MLSEKLFKAKIIDKRSLKRNLDKWKEIGTILFESYWIWLWNSFYFKSTDNVFCNRKSAIHNAEFVPSEISDLLKNKDI